MNPADAISLTKSLLRFDTVNPPGRERDCARFAGALLEEWGYSVEYFEYQEGRTSVVARAGGRGAGVARQQCEERSKRSGSNPSWGGNCQRIGPSFSLSASTPDAKKLAVAASMLRS